MAIIAIMGADKGVRREQKRRPMNQPTTREDMEWNCPRDSSLSRTVHTPPLPFARSGEQQFVIDSGAHLMFCFIALFTAPSVDRRPPTRRNSSPRHRIGLPFFIGRILKMPIITTGGEVFHCHRPRAP